MLRRKLPWRSERSHPVRPDFQMSQVSGSHVANCGLKKNIQLHSKRPAENQNWQSSKTSPKKLEEEHSLGTFSYLSSCSHSLSSIIYVFLFYEHSGSCEYFCQKKTSSLQTLYSCYPRSHVGKMFWHNPTGRIRNSIQILSGILSQWYY